MSDTSSLATVEATPPGFRLDGGEVMTAEEVAGELRLSTKTVYRLTQSGHLPFVPLGRSRRYLRSELMRFLREGGATRVTKGRRC